ncbi:alpha/beta fold hydrolase [Nocardioides litoris]|uniref:alpha/beta fold hydrolase n=1 Tax=Nocardioides litoris TaxID=1926648 RepID=UPI00111CFD55|nr:alpha/beta fold hydrolase [Nocardioides litoris]
MSTHARERVTEVVRDGLVLDVLDEGPIDGDVVVLLHGFPERATSWRHVAPLLHGHGYRTLALDQRGYSPRARPRRRRDYKVDQLVEDVVALVDRVGGPVHLVGHDWGAVVGWSVTGKRPDLVRTWTAVSVPHPRAFLRSFTSSTQALKSYYMLLFNIPGLPELLARRSPDRMVAYLRRAGMTAEEGERFRHEVLEDGAFRGGLGYYRALPLPDPNTRNPRIRRPTTLVWSDADVALGRKGVDLTAAWVDAPYELVVLQGVSHWVPTQAPEALAEAVLERLASA